MINFANDGLALRASWKYEPDGQSKAIYWSRIDEEKIEPKERPFLDLDSISQQLIKGSLHSVPLYVGLEFAKERISWKADKQTMQEAVDDMKLVCDQMKETNEQLNKELGHLSAKNDQLIHDFNEQVIALESLLKALGRKPTTNNLVLDLAIAITELQAKGNKNV